MPKSNLDHKIIMQKHLVKSEKKRIFVENYKRMPKCKIIALDFEIDKLTNSIENTRTGQSHPTSVLSITMDDLAKIKNNKTWQFDWSKEHRLPGYKVYKLTTKDSPEVIQGLISIGLQPDHIRMNLIESAELNKGKGKAFAGVLGNLVAFACKTAFEKGFEGAVSFYAKTKLIEHYKKELGATHFGGTLMIITNLASKNLVDKYFPHNL
jgi:hypothetical protein